MNLLDSLRSEERERVRRETQPDWFSPMLATLTHEHFNDPDWIFERKLDGQRCLVFKKGSEVSLYSRNRHPQNDRFPELVEPLRSCCGKHFVADGEIVAFQDGVTSFSRLQPRMNASKPDLSIGVKLYLFDLLHLDGFNLEKLPLRTRKKLLKEQLSFRDPLRFTPHRNEDGRGYLKEACGKGWEGLVAKDASAPYVHSRSPHWLKFKCEARQEFVIGGYTEPQGEREAFGALLLGVHRGESLRYAGKVGTGYDQNSLRSIKEKLDALATAESPFEEFSSSRDSVHWVKPELVAEVRFTEWTGADKLRHPSFIGLRTDKDPATVVKE